MRLPKALRQTAYHEAGHAVAAYWFHVRLDAATIQPKGDSLGAVGCGHPLKNRHPDWDASPRNREYMERWAMVCLAGPHAERRFNPRRYNAAFSRSDYSQTLTLVDYFVGSNEQAEAYLRLLDIQAKDFVRLPNIWRVIRAVAQVLLHQRTIGRQKLRAVIGESIHEERTKRSQGKHAPRRARS